MSYSVPELIELATQLKKLGVYKFKAGEVEMELLPQQETKSDLAPEDQEKALRDAHEELQRELEGAA